MARQRTDTTTSGSILADAYGALTRVFGGLWTRYGGWGWSKIRLFLPGARFDWEREAGDTWINPIVALAIAWLGCRFVRPHIGLARIGRDGKQIPVPRHAAVDLWNRPNRYYSRRTLEKAIGLSLICDGNAYIYKVRDRLGRVCELWWVPHYRILPTWPADGSQYIDGYRVWLDTAVYHLPPGDIVHIRDGIDPRNERLGLSALRANLREVCSDNLVSGYTAALMKNSGVPGIMIVPDGEGGTPRPSDAAKERIEERFVEEFSGDRTGRPLVMAGKYRIEPVGFTPEEMALDKLPRSAEARIAAATGVAAMSLGLPDPNKTYANLGEANRSSWGTIVSTQELVGDELRWQLLPEPIATETSSSPGADPHQFVFVYDYAHIQELQESLDAVHARAREDFKADGITRNEYREAIGYEPMPDSDLFFSDVQAAKSAAAAPRGEDDDQAAGDADGPKALFHTNGRAGSLPASGYR
jgi:HK97 family phage portal protein